jgi:hypothetical protein
MSRLIARIEHPDIAHPPMNTIIPTELIIRQSSLFRQRARNQPV